MSATLLFIHGRRQASPRDIAADPARLATYVATKKRNWLAGLSRGLMHAGLPPVTDAVFPFYGNEFRRSIEEYEAGGGRRPELELGLPDDKQEKQLIEAKSAALIDALDALGFDPARELSYLEPGLAVGAEGVRPEELGWGDVLRIPVLRAGLQFLSRKTGAPAAIIEEFLTDVAYYLELEGMRSGVLDILEQALRAALPNGGPVVVVGHSLGSIAAYDFLTRLPDGIDVRLLVTAGSPLGYPIVQKNLLGHQPGRRPRVPNAVPARAAAWLNAYDERDFVSLVHPLAGSYDVATKRQLVDERTLNSSDPHSIADYLSDPDVAGPIGRAIPD